MERRTFIGGVAGGLATAPLSLGAQPTGKVYRTGYLSILARAETLR